jgi:hypothetical protein
MCIGTEVAQAPSLWNRGAPHALFECHCVYFLYAFIKKSSLTLPTEHSMRVKNFKLSWGSMPRSTIVSCFWSLAEPPHFYTASSALESTILLYCNHSINSITVLNIILYLWYPNSYWNNYCCILTFVYMCTEGPHLHAALPPPPPKYPIKWLLDSSRILCMCTL